MIFEAANKPFTAKSIPFPKLKPGEVLVKNAYSTICKSDLHSYFGRRCSHSHSILGHEIVGKTEAIHHDGVTDFYNTPLKIGDKITWSVYAHDPDSSMAQKGIPQKCDKLYKYGHETIDDRNSLNGGFASHCHLLKGTSIFKIPSNLDHKEAAPLNCTYATIAGALRLAGDIKGKNVLISGAGMLGVSACAMSQYYGAGKVWAIDLKNKRLNLAKKFGASYTFEASATNSEITKTADLHCGIDLIIETSGDPAAVERSIDLLSIGGTLILVGSVFSQRNCAINAEKIVRNLLTIKGLHNYVPEDLGKAIDFLSATKDTFPFADLVGREYPLYQLKEAFDAGNTGNYYRVGINPADEDSLNTLLF